jgi:methenyltetrahydromethanopterin cyclohydrolase
MDQLRERLNRIVNRTLGAFERRAMAKAQEQEEPEEIEIDEIDEIETKVLTVDADEMPQTIEEYLADGWALDDHIVVAPRVTLIFSREKE